MSFLLAFARTLLWQPHRALAALYWYATGRRVRARNRLRLAASQSMRAYAWWIASVEGLEGVKQSAAQMIAGWANRPRFSILHYLDPQISAKDQTAAIASVLQQYYGEWELILVPSTAAAPPRLPDDPRIRIGAESARNAAEALTLGLAETQGDYVLPLEQGCRLSAAALFRMGEALQDPGSPAILYGDEDSLNRWGRRTRPWFKPAWNEEMFLAQDYISSACAIRADLARGAPPIGDDLSAVAPYALLLSIVASGNAEIRHTPHVLCHYSASGKNSVRQAERVAAVALHLKGSKAQALPGPFGTVRVQWPLLAEPPLVSIIVPTRDKVKLLRTCVDGVLSSTRYPRMELIIVDNGSIEPATHRYLEAVTSNSRVRVLSYSAPYNYSAINNFATTEARGGYLCLLNNDTEVLDGDWLTEMMRQAVRSHIGAVGAKLLYPDGSIQHAGVVIGIHEAAGHVHRFLHKDKPGYFKQAHIPHYVSAVTAACLLVEKSKFDAVGGLDADNLAIAFNDVDLCLKLEAAGWRNVYAPQAVLIHHESKSRGKDSSPQHIARYLRELAVLQQRWGTKTYADPLHHPNLNRAHEGYTIRV